MRDKLTGELLKEFYDFCRACENYYDDALFDAFVTGFRRPIDVIKANRPIIILDEPQKMGGDVTQKALKNFNPLFTLN